jgi:hypothetical protein
MVFLAYTIDSKMKSFQHVRIHLQRKKKRFQDSLLLDQNVIDRDDKPMLYYKYKSTTSVFKVCLTASSHIISISRLYSSTTIIIIKMHLYMLTFIVCILNNSYSYYNTLL